MEFLKVPFQLSYKETKQMKQINVYVVEAGSRLQRLEGRESSAQTNVKKSGGRSMVATARG